MAKDGQARVLTDDQFNNILEEIEDNRHPEKNALIIQVSFKLGLRVQEMSLLRIKEVVEISPKYHKGYKLHDVLVLPKNFTKGARATKRSPSKEPQRTSVRFSLTEFDRLVRQIESMAKAGIAIDPEDHYPQIKKKAGKTRELPLVDEDLRAAISRYIDHRMLKKPLKPHDPLFFSQKGGPYSPNTLQDHMRLMLRNWGGVARSSSHSGRRTLATKMIHESGEHIKTVQQILGHKDPATTTIYQELPEGEVKTALEKIGKSYG